MKVKCVSTYLSKEEVKAVFWRAQENFLNFTLWPIEFYRDFFHDDLREEKPGLKRAFDIVVDRLTHEFQDTAPTVPRPLI